MPRVAKKRSLPVQRRPEQIQWIIETNSDP
jgi:hypothetical protein